VSATSIKSAATGADHGRSAVGSFAVRLLRRATVGTRQCLAGTELQTDARTAQQLLREGTARLVDDHDVVRLVKALQPFVGA
jgi:hypothetical protein